MNSLPLIVALVFILTFVAIGFALYWFLSSIKLTPPGPPARKQKRHRTETDELINQFMASIENRKEKPKKRKLSSKDPDEPTDMPS